MRVLTRAGLITITAALAALFSYAQVRPIPNVLWLDFDMQNIPEPKERPSGMSDYFFKGQLLENWKRTLDAPRLVRTVAGHPKPAINVNALDEVPDSSWYKNRHYLRHMTVDELARGPNQSAGPDFRNAMITKAKTGGVTPGLQLKDRKGDSYVVKFDSADYPELQSGAEVISTKILYAAGYNVPENYIATIDPKELEIEHGVETTDKNQVKRPFTRDDLVELLSHAAKLPNGRYRVLASKILPGKAKGPFPQVGLRRDDPNDQIPHEHRRELRGLRVIASWINHWDMKEENSLDMYVEENGRHFLRHYLIDFGSTLGAGKDPTEYFHGREYVFDFKDTMKELFTLGSFDSPSEKRARLFSPEVGGFTADDFDAEGWKTSFPVIAFENMTREDAFWATRIILSFTEAELRRIVETAQYTNSKNTDYVLRTLLERRRIVARLWLGKMNPLAKFSIRPADGGIVLTFRDLMVDCGCDGTHSAEYTYQVGGRHYTSEKRTTRDSSIVLDRAVLGAAVEANGINAPIEVTLWTNHRESIPELVKVDIHWNPTVETPSIERISRR